MSRPDSHDRSATLSPTLASNVPSSGLRSPACEPLRHARRLGHEQRGGRAPPALRQRSLPKPPRNFKRGRGRKLALYGERHAAVMDLREPYHYGLPLALFRRGTSVYETEGHRFESCRARPRCRAEPRIASGASSFRGTVSYYRSRPLPRDNHCPAVVPQGKRRTG
jgi:hypothetical protein